MNDIFLGLLQLSYVPIIVIIQHIFVSKGVAYGPIGDMRKMKINVTYVT